MRIKLEGWYDKRLRELATEHNTTPTQLITEFIKSHTAQDAKDTDNDYNTSK